MHDTQADTIPLSRTSVRAANPFIQNRQISSSRTRITLIILSIGLGLCGPMHAIDEPSYSMRAGELFGLGGRCLEAAGSALEDGTPVVINTCDGNSAQSWDLLLDGRIVGPEEKCLTVGPVGDSGFKEAILGPCAAGAELHRWSTEGRFPESFRVEALGTGECLDVLRSNDVSGTPVILFPCHGLDNQRWSYPAAPSNELLVPYFMVSRLPDGTQDVDQIFFRLHNASELEMEVKILWVATHPVGDLGAAEVETHLHGRETYLGHTALASHLLGEDPRRNGLIRISAFDPDTLLPLESPPLYGGYSRLSLAASDDEQSTATGGSLIWSRPTTGPTGLCNRWLSYFIDTDSDQKTEVALYSQDAGGFNLEGRVFILAFGDVYSLTGNFVRRIHVFGDHSRRLVIDRDALNLPVLQGTIEWTFANDALGYVTSTLTRANLGSIGLPGHCLDP